MPSRLSEEEIAQIKDFYGRGKGSIQDYARIYGVSVAEVLDLIGEGDMKTVHVGGDLVDEAELGPTGKGQINYGEDVAVPYTTN